MQIMTPEPDGASAVYLSVRIDPQRASLLYNNACRASEMIWDGRFETLGDGVFLPDDPVWDSGRLMWCDSALDAMVLADYEAACGYQSLLLWDLASFDSGFPGHVVLSSRALDFGHADL